MHFMLGFLLATATLVAETIDFEGHLDGTSLTNQYPGVTFSNATVLTAGVGLNEFDFPPQSGTNVLMDDGGPITIGFATPITGITAYATYTLPITMRAFDLADNLLGTAVSAFANNTLSAGDAGSTTNEPLTITATGISRVTIEGDPLGASVVIDDLTTANGIPEPHTFSLALLAVMSLLARKVYNSARARARMSPLAAMLAFAVIVIACTHLEAQTVFGPTNATPGLINTGAPAVVVVTSTITDPTVNTTGINLLRLHPNGGTSIVGQLRDDGTNGDAVGNDNTYTIQASFNETNETTLRLQISAAIRGTIRRTTSPIMNVYVTLPGLPPDPGEAGKQTITGTDYDRDGIRDDVQRYIALTYPNAPNTRSGLTQAAIALQAALVANGSQYQSVGTALASSLLCLIQLRSDGRDVYGALKVQQLNTEPRLLAFYEYSDQFNGQVLHVPDQTCTFSIAQGQQ